MAAFVLAAALLVALTLLLLLRPWRRRGAAGNAASAREINAGVYRDQLRELERDLAAGTLAAADHAQASAELQRRLLDDTGAADTAPAATPGTRTTSLLIALALPLLAAALYVGLGAPDALDERARRGATQGDVEQMVAALAARLESKPDDPKGWVVLARSYRAMGRMQEAGNAFARIGPALDSDPALLAEYADVLATLAQGRFEGRPGELVARSLAIDPGNPLALALAATAASNRNDTAQAALYWRRLLKGLPPESEDAKWVAARLAEIGGAAGTSDAALAAPGGSAASAAAAAGVAITGRVSLAPALAAQVLPTDTVFVFARATQGPRMPLAVQRARVADLPLAFKLDDTQAMSPELKLSGAAEVRIEARISRSGSATPGPDDLIGTGPVVKPGVRDVAIVIDHRRP